MPGLVPGGRAAPSVRIACLVRTARLAVIEQCKVGIFEALRAVSLFQFGRAAAVNDRAVDEYAAGISGLSFLEVVRRQQDGRAEPSARLRQVSPQARSE